MPVAPGTKESYIGAFVENIIYGVYLSVFVECCTLFWKKKDTRGVKHIYLLVTTALLFILITMRCIIDTYRCVVAFDNPEVDFGSPNTVLGVLTNALEALVTTVADVFIVFRTFIVWNRNWYIVVIPALLCLANFGTGILVLVTQVQSATQNASVEATINALNAFLSLTLATNIVSTGLISFRIIKINRDVASMASSNRSPARSASMRILSIIVESAAMYTLLLTAILITNRYDEFVTFALIDCTPPTIGLVFSYIIIRVSRGTSYESTVQGIPASTLRLRDQTLHLEGVHLEFISSFFHSPTWYSPSPPENIGAVSLKQGQLSSHWCILSHSAPPSYNTQEWPKDLSAGGCIYFMGIRDTYILSLHQGVFC
ncbi:hypothetical protein MSAN_01755500 [Mycena sanguinolenta]|uniref:Uncharacterized protein n=1 Tax=Mycena sanguinolenta TaxID=230812 RepID=A0A8H6XWU9_9AGAR|nr:hypothetical protein MSAN_01755500 [Mycena sanguinolenta]